VFLASLLNAARAAERPNWSHWLRQPEAWYRGPEARRAAQNVLSFQTPRGDWPKNTDTFSRPCTGDRHALQGTFDNGATVHEIRFLARVHRCTGDADLAEAVRRAVDHLLAAQYANGGWPQHHPPGNGYARHITFNDGVMVNLMELVRAVARDADFAFLDAKRRDRAAAAFARGLECILRCQVRAGGRLTVWAAQHDEVTLEPRPARAFEPAALAAAESAGVLRLLMSLPEPTPEVCVAIRAGAAWFESARLTGLRQVTRDGDKGIEPAPDAPPLWARFYEPDTVRPVFAGRDGVVKYALAEIERERRTGYAWYGDWGLAVAREFARWSATHADCP
jgi:pectate lyase